MNWTIQPVSWITDEGYGPQFNHRLGHFIGLSEHEFGDVFVNTDKAVFRYDFLY